ncbi:hypothetical protein SDC9_112083 [bioreactor metagenome]|uniref:Uncharacterized protein n=1 Tax=bioreactor metagenome TaxID=1076179 RepID=A0A645BKX7_9ZZZZ
MIRVKEFEDKYSELIQTVESELDLVNKGLKEKSNQQLKSIISDLNKMNAIRDSNQFLPRYPRFIVDSWDFSDLLGIELLKFYELYKKIKN